MMLFSMLSAAQGGKSIVFLSRHFGLSNRQMTNVIRHYLPILMRGIQKNFAQQGGLSSLLKTLDKGNYGSYYDDPNIYTNPDVRHRGITIMERALGGDDIQRKILHRIYLSTGIDPDTLQLILPFVTTLALSTLYRKAHTQLNPSAMPNQLAYHGPNGNPQPQVKPRMPIQPNAPRRQQAPMPPNNTQHQYQQPPQQTQRGFAPQPQPSQFQQQMQRQPEARQELPGMRQQQPAAMPVSNPHNGAQPQHQPPVQPQQNGHQHQQPSMPAQQPQQERLPNIILQAQEAHAQKQRKISKKGRLSRMLKVPFQLAQGQQSQTPPAQEQYNNGNGQYHQQNQYYAEQHHTQQLQPSQPNLPQPRGPERKYVSLQEKLSAQLPWYEQTG
ncbi:MAG: DUF937 domain-containing protein [Methyloligellaceae bacterium]